MGIHVLGPNSGIPGSLGVSEVSLDSRTVTITRCDGVTFSYFDVDYDTEVSFHLGPFLNRNYASTNHEGSGDSSALRFNMKVIGKDRSGSFAIIEEADIDAPPIQAQ